MPELKAAEHGVGVNVVSVALVSCSLERLPGQAAVASDSRPNILFNIGLGRPASDELVVEMKFTFDRLHGLKLALTYGVHFKRTATVEDEDAYWRDVTTQVAPVVLYPYVRETVTALTSRAAVPPVILPVLNFKTMIDPAGIVVPPLTNTVTAQ